MNERPSRRMTREHRTISAMIHIYCREQHDTPVGLCPECESLLGYAQERLTRCPYQERKPTCAQCPIHCYHPDRREQVRAVMGYAGPRMLLRHPWLALLHLLDGLRKESPDHKQ